MSEDGSSLWERFTRDIMPLRKPKPSVKAVPPPPPKKAGKKKTEGSAVSLPPLKAPPAAAAPAPQLDGHKTRKLKAGKIPFEATLDLHGYNRNQAYDMLQQFISVSQNKGMRCVLVVTGKGTARLSSEEWIGAQPGVLRQLVPQWLAANPLVLQTQEAKPKHGGSGALYVYLRKERS